MRSIACTAVVGSFTAGESARMATSTSWRNTNPGSWISVRSPPRRKQPATSSPVTVVLDPRPVRDRRGDCDVLTDLDEQLDVRVASLGEADQRGTVDRLQDADAAPLRTTSDPPPPDVGSAASAYASAAGNAWSIAALPSLVTRFNRYWTRSIFAMPCRNVTNMASVASSSRYTIETVTAGTSGLLPSRTSTSPFNANTNVARNVPSVRWVRRERTNTRTMRGEY